jgi:hypothetical protein
MQDIKLAQMRQGAKISALYVMVLAVCVFFFVHGGGARGVFRVIFRTIFKKPRLVFLENFD